MRIIVLILAVLGVAAAGVSGAMWFQAGTEELPKEEKLLKGPLSELARTGIRAHLPMLVVMPFVMAAGLVLGILAVILFLASHNKCAAILLLLIAIGPLAVAGRGWVWIGASLEWQLVTAGPCAVLALAGLLALLVRSEPALARAGGGDEDDDDDEED